MIKKDDLLQLIAQLESENSDLKKEAASREAYIQSMEERLKVFDELFSEGYTSQQVAVLLIDRSKTLTPKRITKIIRAMWPHLNPASVCTEYRELKNL